MKAYWVLLLLMMAGCSTSPVEQLRLNRTYQLTLLPVTRLGSTGYSCYPFSGAMVREGSVLLGELRKQSGLLYLLQGQVLLSGNLHQARLVNYMGTVELDGQLKDETGGGLWHTKAGCRGIWRADALN